MAVSPKDQTNDEWIADYDKAEAEEQKKKVREGEYYGLSVEHIEYPKIYTWGH